MPNPDVVDMLKAIVGPKGWLEGTDTARYTDDPRGRVKGAAELVLRPGTVSEVSAVMAICNDAGVGIIPFGGGTGGANGHLDPMAKHVVMSLERMTRIRSVSAKDSAITVEAGVRLADVQDAAEGIGCIFGLSLASEGSCTIGGNLASNAGGVRTLRYGNARDLCLGLEVVMADGSVLSDLAPLRKNNTGYDLRHLLIGSEGTLGIITAATLKLSPRPQRQDTVFCAVASPEAALDLLNALRVQLGEVVSAFELMSALGLSLAIKHFPELRDPFGAGHQWYVLGDIAGPQDLSERLEGAMAQAFDAGLVKDAVVATSGAQAAALWALRENAFEYNRLEGVLYSSDTSVPLSRIADFVARVEKDLAGHDHSLRANFYGHIGDGNIHVNVFAPEGQRQAYLERDPDAADVIAKIIDTETVACNGSISAEHGIGRARVEALRRYGDPTRLALMRAVKQALDPKGIMNPGALL